MKRIIVFFVAFLIGGCASNISEQDAQDTWQWNNSSFGGISSVGIKRSICNNQYYGNGYECSNPES